MLFIITFIFIYYVHEQKEFFTVYVIEANKIDFDFDFDLLASQARGGTRPHQSPSACSLPLRCTGTHW
jgi:hypothetical protein